MKYIAGRTVVDDHDPTEVRFDATEILNVVASAKGTMLTVVTSDEILSILFEPVDDRIGVLLNRCGEDDEIVPFADL